MSHTATVKTAQFKDAQDIVNACKELNQQGINCHVEFNAVPRMWTENQIGRDLGYDKHPTDECEVVVRIPDAFYDVGFIRTEEGNLMPVFDDYNGRAIMHHDNMGHKPVRDVLGAKFEGRIEHWNGLREESEDNEGSQQLRHSIGKLMQGIHKSQAIRRAQAMGHYVMGSTTDENGHIHVKIGIPD